MPKVSVIIPVYNVEKYLHECLDSVINQTLKDIEIIAVDDGSTDSSLKILKDYAKKDKRLKVLTQENKGAGAARNLGMKHATGFYLSILDSDDYFDHSMLELLYKKAEKTKADITICRSQQLDEETKNIEPMPWTLKTNFLPEKEVFNYKDIIGHVFDFCVGWSWDKLYKTSFVKKTKLEFQNLRSTNDAFFVFMSLLHADKMTMLDNILVTHRKNTCTSLSETRDKDPNCFLDAVFAMKKYMDKNGFYASVQKSFINWLCHFCFWHLDTLQNQENKEKLKNRLKNEVFKDFGIYNLSENFFYNKKIYQRIHSKNIKQNLPFYQKIFSIKKSNDKKYKIVRLFGLRIKFKRKKFGGCSFLEYMLSIKNSKDKRYKIIRVCGLRVKLRNNRFVKKISKKVHKIGPKIIHILTKPIRVQEKYYRLKQEYKRLKNLK